MNERLESAPRASRSFSLLSAPPPHWVSRRAVGDGEGWHPISKCPLGLTCSAAPRHFSSSLLLVTSPRHFSSPSLLLSLLLSLLFLGLAAAAGCSRSLAALGSARAARLLGKGVELALCRHWSRPLAHKEGLQPRLLACGRALVQPLDDLVHTRLRGGGWE